MSIYSTTRLIEHTLIENPSSAVQSTNHNCRLNKKVENITLNPHKRTTNTKSMIKLSLIVPWMILGKILICARSFSRRPNIWRRLGCKIMKEEATLSLQVPRSAWLIAKIWILFLPLMWLRYQNFKILNLRIRMTPTWTTSWKFLTLKR